MKKLITSLLLLLSITAYSQTMNVQRVVLSTKDTAVITTSTPPPVITQGAPSVSIAIKAYIPPVVTPPPVITPPPVTGTVGGTVSGAIALKSNTTYSGLTISINSATQPAMSGNGVTNVHITNCKIINPTGFGINLQGCTGITIDNCFITNTGFGVYAQGGCKTIKVNSNQFLNINGINTNSLGHAIQFNGVTGSGNQIENNRIENIAGVALHPHDQINVYQSSGLAGDSIMVTGNWVRGGQQTMWPTSNSGAAGIVVADVLNSSYQVCRNNIVVNPGYIGIQAQGGTHIKVDHNKVFGETSHLGGSGFSWGNYSGQASSDVTYAYNQATFVRWDGSALGWNFNGTAPILTGNNWNAGLTAGILPAVIITMK